MTIEAGFLDASRDLYQEHRPALGDVDSDPVFRAVQIRVEVADVLRQLTGRVCLNGALHPHRQLTRRGWKVLTCRSPAY
jgi:hypothetical protein